MKNLRLIIILGSIACSLSACNTVRGVGEDVEVTGHAVEQAATPTHYHHYHYHYY